MTLNLYFNESSQVNDEDNKQKEVMEMLHRIFRPEFIGRIDSVIKFNQIGKQHYHQIVYNQVSLEIKRFKQNTGINVSVKEEVYDHLSKMHMSSTYGVRQIKHFLQENLYNQIIDMACDMNENDKKSKHLLVSVNNNKINIQILDKSN